MKILGIETSCDETAAAVVELTDMAAGATLLSNVVASSMDLHVQYGGVVPEIAARSHIESILPVINEALYVAKYGQGADLSGVQGADEKQTAAVRSGTAQGASESATKQSAKSAQGKLGFAQLAPSKVSALWDDIDAIAVTYGAGLGGSLLVGVLTARTLAIAHNKPLYGINHVEGHVYANFITKTSLPGYVSRETVPAFPMLAVIVSGGHSQLALFKDHFDYQLLGQTRDDAIGEAFDKVAKILGLPYPGGPSVQNLAKQGDRTKYTLPIAKLSPRTTAGIRQRVQHSDAVQGGGEERNESYRKVRRASAADANAAMRAVVESGKYDFSYSGLKTAVLRLAQAETGNDYTFPSFKLPEALSDAQKADIAASFAYIATKAIVDKVKQAYDDFNPASVVIAGGVAASPEIRNQLSAALPVSPEYPDLKICTDNGAMIATLGAYKALSGQPTADPYTLDIAPNLSM